MPDVLMPRLSDTMEKGVLSQRVKHEGDQVRKGDVLAVIETVDGATAAGFLTHLKELIEQLLDIVL